jgi:hypothetical protein
LGGLNFHRDIFQIERHDIMKLYFSPGTCSIAPHIVAREAGIDLTVVKIDLASKKTANGRDFMSINFEPPWLRKGCCRLPHGVQ